MKKTFIFSVFQILFLVGTSQDTKKVVLRNCVNNQVSEIYFVKKSDKTIKHGVYQEFACDANKTDENIIDTTKLKFGLKTNGLFVEGQKVGVWTEVKRTTYGYIIEKYNYSTNQKLEPLFEVYLKYPPYAQENEIQGEVEVSFQENSDCTITDLTITKTLHKSCDEETKRKLQKIYELKRQHNCKCENKRNSLKVEFKLD